MKRLLATWSVAIALMPLVTKAQSTTTNGPKLDLNENAITYVLEDNDDFMRIFSMGRGLWGGYNDIIISSGYNDIIISKYDKQTNTLSEQVVDDDFKGRFAFLSNENTTVNVVRFVANKKTMMLECQKASFPVDVKVPKKLFFETFFSFPMTPYAKSINDCKIHAVYNADRSKFAIVSMYYQTREQKERHIEVAVFDNEVALLWHESGSIIGDAYTYFGINNIKVALDGTVYVSGSESYRTKGKNESYVYIVTCSQQGIFGYKNNIESPLEYYGFKRAVLPNGEFRLVGVNAKEGESKGKLFTYMATPDGDVDYVEEDVDISPYVKGVKYDEKKLEKKLKGFTPYMSDLICLQDGNLLLVGGMNCIVDLSDWASDKTANLSHNIMCAKVGADGKLTELNVFPRATVTSESGNWHSFNPVYAFEHDGDVYLMYNDHRDNYSGNVTQWNTLYYNRPDHCSVVLSKIENNGELSSTILYNAKTKLKDPRMIVQQHNHEFFLKFMQQEDDGMYYILKRDDDYHLEKVSVE